MLIHWLSSGLDRLGSKSIGSPPTPPGQSVYGIKGLRKERDYVIGCWEKRDSLDTSAAKLERTLSGQFVATDVIPHGPLFDQTGTGIVQEEPSAIPSSDKPAKGVTRKTSTKSTSSKRSLSSHIQRGYAS